MNASGACLSVIKRFEGCRLTAYRDPGGVLTIGWGHTGPDVQEGMTIGQGWADALFKGDIGKREAQVAQLTDGLVLTQGQFDALVSFVYNLGAGALAESTLLMMLKAGDLAGAEEEFLRWVFEKKNGVEVQSPGLLERRRAERLMFIGGRG